MDEPAHGCDERVGLDGLVGPGADEPLVQQALDPGDEPRGTLLGLGGAELGEDGGDGVPHGGPAEVDGAGEVGAAPGLEEQLVPAELAGALGGGPAVQHGGEGGGEGVLVADVQQGRHGGDVAMSRPRSAAVVGAGIGGLATAVALRRTGWSVTVHERADALRAVGAGLSLGPNAVHALDALGLGAAVRERAHTLTASALRRPDGRRLGRLDTAAVAARHGAPFLALDRATLHRLLADALGPEAVRCGSPVADAAALTDEHDLVVAADGLHSATRTRAWSDDAHPVYAGYTTWRVLVRTEAPVTEATETWGHRERFGVVPVGDDRVYLFATATLPEGGRASDDELDELRRRFGRWHAPVPALLDAADPTAVLRHDVHALSRVPAVLHRGRVALVGDAAHAMEPNLGQGAGLALEDAVVLAHELADDAPAEDALARYTALRRPRAARLHAASARLGRATQHTGRAASAARDLVVRLTPDGLAVRGSDGTLGWRAPA